MGILNFIKQGVQEMLIARPDDKKNLLVYKHPDRTVPMYAQLTVDADEAAVFFRDGALVGTLRTAGVGQRHTLSSQNIPFLGQLIDRVTGGNVFVTDLFFVTMRPIYNVPFGGELGAVEDPLLGEMVSPRIYGTFSFQVVNPEALILRYLGLRPTTAEEQERWIKGAFMNSVKTVVGQVLVEQQKSYLQLMPMQAQIAQLFQQSAPDLNEIGIRVLGVGEFHINLTREDEERLKEAQAEIGAAKRAARKAQIGIAQAQAEAQARQFELDQRFAQDARYVQQLAGGNFAQYAAGQAMIGAGQGMAKGGGEGAGAMMSGAGLGVGFGMAALMQQGFAQSQPAPAGAAAAAPPAARPTGPVTCPQCGHQQDGGKFCVACGASLAPKPKFCPACGAQGQPSAKFCAECGTAFPV
ncbi:MAG: SPFH domain-containing protein [Myxococcota bacterium]|nr:SPFH domain-containing protein [Myxococcota bacterium]MDW8361358.1 SPFH domain-containing protein [Myxococcales bacterium]